MKRKEKHTKQTRQIITYTQTEMKTERKSGQKANKNNEQAKKKTYSLRKGIYIFIQYNANGCVICWKFIP